MLGAAGAGDALSVRAGGCRDALSRRTRGYASTTSPCTDLQAAVSYGTAAAAIPSSRAHRQQAEGVLSLEENF